MFAFSCCAVIAKRKVYMYVCMYIHISEPGLQVWIEFPVHLCFSPNGPRFEAAMLAFAFWKRKISPLARSFEPVVLLQLVAALAS